ncbi:MAG: alanine racemase C-terminal domain-containing protein [Actinomycetota bacterium]
MQADANDLRPALTWRARVSHVQRLAAGERISYGLRHRLERESMTQTIRHSLARGQSLHMTDPCAPCQGWSQFGRI